MTNEHLYYFREICKYKSISRAAKITFQSPQNLSNTVKALEKELDSILLIRSSSGVDVTDAGRLVLQYAEYRLQEHEELQKELALLKKKQEEEIHLLSSYGVLRLVTPEAILHFKEIHPEIRFSYEEYPDCTVEEHFDATAGNVAFAIAPVDEEKYDVDRLISIPFSVIVNHNHRFATRRSLSIMDLRNEPLVLESRKFKINHIINSICEANGFAPNILFETSGFSLCKSMVARGSVISVVVGDIYKEMRSDKIVEIPLREDLKWEICMITRKGDPIPASVQCFKKYVLEQLKENFG